MKAPFSPHPCQHLLFLVFLIIPILTGVRYYLTVVLISISMMISDVEHLFMSTGHFSVFGKMSVQVLCPFFNWIFWFFDIELHEMLVYFGD